MQLTEILTTLLPVLLAYLLGALPFALFFARLAGVDDLRKHGSGNLGATNVWRAAGGKVAALVFAADIGKGVVAVLIAKAIGTTLLSTELFLVICASAAVLGHIFPVYLSFRGGKGVNTALGVMLVLLPFETLASLVVFGVVVSLFRIVSLGSISAACALAAILLVQKYGFGRPVADAYLSMTVLLAVTVILAHRQNIRRIMAGNENRLSFAGRGKKSDSDD